MSAPTSMPMPAPPPAPMSTPMTRTAPPSRPWFREPLVWLVIGLPAVVVAASVWTLVIAINAGGADSVADTVQRTGKAQVSDLGPDREAARLGLAGRLAVDLDSGALRVELQGAAADAQPALLWLELRHPVRAEDQRLPLSRAGEAWQGRLPPAASEGVPHDWILRVAPEDVAWRLAGRLEAGAAEATLNPAVAAE